MLRHALSPNARFEEWPLLALVSVTRRAKICRLLTRIESALMEVRFALLDFCCSAALRSTRRWIAAPLHCGECRHRKFCYFILTLRTYECESKKKRVASERGHLELVQLLLERGANVNAGLSETVGRGTSPLFMAAQVGRLLILLLLCYRYVPSSSHATATAGEPARRG